MRVALNYAGQLDSLDDNWDSYGAKKPTEAARETLSFLSAVPVSDGGVQIELHAGGSEIEIEIAPSGKIRSVFVEPTKEGPTA